MRVAVLSDVHGNLPALEAVLDDLARQHVDATVFLGDHVSGPIDPAGTAARIMALAPLAIRGNHDRWVLDLASRAMPWAADVFARSQLDAAAVGWLAGLPASAVLDDQIYLCHGTPQSDEAPWLDNFYTGRATTLPTETEIARQADGIDQPVLLCGHTHIARSLRLNDGRLIVNPGAVGMQLLRGTPDAHYAIVEKRRAGWQAALMGVAYDTEAAARQAEENGFPGWGASIRHGWAGPETLG